MRYWDQSGVTRGPKVLRQKKSPRDVDRASHLRNGYRAAESPRGAGPRYQGDQDLPRLGGGGQLHAVVGGGALAAVAGKVGLSGRMLAVVPDDAAAVRAQKGARQQGVLVEVEVSRSSHLPADDASFDLVVSDMTDPVEDGPSTFCFTREYFEQVRRVLRPHGVVAVQAGPASPIEVALHAKVIRTMQSVFTDVVPYAVDAPCYGRDLGFVIASQSPLASRLTVSSIAGLSQTLRGSHRWLHRPAARACASCRVSPASASTRPSISC